MRRWVYALLFGVVLGVVVPAALSSDAFAQAGLDRIEQKVQDLQDLVSKVLVVVVVIGAMFVGFRFIQGDPNTWKYAMMFVLGATIIFSAQALMQWLKS
jgi:type IV secretory pathway VirB2 component (pilin)